MFRAAALLILALTAGPAPAAGLVAVDGDTVKADGVTVRLVGFDTPESGDHARCPAERALADRATARLRAILATGNARLTFVPCSCRAGTEGTRRCNYGRACGVLTFEGRDVAAIMAAEWLARPYVCERGKCPRRLSWCD